MTEINRGVQYAKLTRSMKYQVRYEHQYGKNSALMTRLSDGRRQEFTGAVAEAIDMAITVIEHMDVHHLGSKPSRAFCKAFDAMCEKYIAMALANTLALPYPFCRHPAKCSGTGRCQNDPVCND